GLWSSWRSPTEVVPQAEETLGGADRGRATRRGLRDGLLDLRAHPGADLAGVRRALQLPVCVYVAAQCGVFVSKGPLGVGSSGCGQGPGGASGNMAAHWPGGHELKG